MRRLCQRGVGRAFGRNLRIRVSDQYKSKNILIYSWNSANHVSSQRLYSVKSDQELNKINASGSPGVSDQNQPHNSTSQELIKRRNKGHLSKILLLSLVFGTVLIVAEIKYHLFNTKWLNSLISALYFIKTVLYHKYAIIAAGTWINKVLDSPHTHFKLTWDRMLKHDLSKLSPTEFWGYALWYHDKSLPVGTADEQKKYNENKKQNYEQAFKHHYSINDHHHQFHDGSKMPEAAVLEMLADWFAAALAYSGEYPPFSIGGNGGSWKFIESRYHEFTSEMNEIDVQFMSALLVVFGFESSLMVGLHRKGERFDWGEAYNKIKNAEKQRSYSTPLPSERFKVLQNHYNKIRQ